MLEEHKKRFTFRFTERDSGPSPSTRPTGDNHRFTSSTTTHGERRFRDVDEERDFRRFVYDPRRDRLSSFRLRPTERDDSETSTSHGEKDYRRLVEEPPRHRESPFSQTKDREVLRERKKQNQSEPKTRSPLSSYFAYTCPPIPSLPSQQ